MAKRTKEVIEKLVKEKVCKYQFYKVDSNGLLEFGKDLIDPEIKKAPEGYVDVPPPDGLFQPKWDGDDWVEVGQAPVLENVPPRVPSVEELQKEIVDLKAYIESLVSENKLKLPKVTLPSASGKADKP